MIKKLLLFVLVLLVALIAAIPALADPPPSSGPNVVRYDGIVYLHTVDEAKGLSAIVGADIVEFCNSFRGFDLVSIQDIQVPEDANRIVEIAHGDDVTTSIWPFTDFDCGLFTTVEPVATGTTDVVNTDNDLEVFNNPDNVNWNAYGFTAHGRLTAPDGSTMQLNVMSRCVWDGVDSDSGRCASGINMK